MIEDSATTKSYYLRPCSDIEVSEDTDGIGVGTPNDSAPISRRNRAWHIRRCPHAEYADGNILPALPETMTV
jgi:hypothetical protein